MRDLWDRFWNSPEVRLLRALWALLLFIGDIVTDILVGYDLFVKCHFMYSVATFAFGALPGRVTLSLYKYSSAG